MSLGWTGVILAAGRGTRLAPMTDELPKCLVSVTENRPILYYQLNALLTAGVESIVIVVGYKADMVRAYVTTTFPTAPVTFIHNEAFLDTNTIYSLALVAKLLPAEARVLQMNGDVVFAPEIIAALCAAHPNRSYITTKIGACAEEEVKLLLNADGSVKEISKRISPKDALGEAVGINTFVGPLWEILREELLKHQLTHPKEYFEYALETAIAHGGALYPFDLGVLEAVEVDFPQDLSTARVLTFLRQ